MSELLQKDLEIIEVKWNAHKLLTELSKQINQRNFTIYSQTTLIKQQADAILELSEKLKNANRFILDFNNKDHERWNRQTCLYNQRKNHT